MTHSQAAGTSAPPISMQPSPFAFALGRPFAPLYSLAMRLRERMYRLGVLKSHRLDAVVISIGNLTLGGTGKTPMVQHLARLLQTHGYQPAIISRGYGGSARNRVNVVSDHTSVLLDAHAAGDEPRLLAETLPGVPVLTGIVRRLPAAHAIGMGANVLLLDDGFQHLQVVRDINLVLFNTDRLAGNSRVFPGGDLREPVAGLRRATGFVMTGVDAANRERADRFAELLRSKFPDIPVAQTGYRPEGLVTVSNQSMTPIPLDTIAGMSCFGFCGIAHPESFRRTIIAEAVDLAGFLALDDHQRYSDALLAKVAAEAQRVGAACLLTTEKDLVKLVDRAAGLPLPLYGVRMRVEADSHFDRDLLHAVRGATGRPDRVLH